MRLFNTKKYGAKKNSWDLKVVHYSGDRLVPKGYNFKINEKFYVES